MNSRAYRAPEGFARMEPQRIELSRQDGEWNSRVTARNRLEERKIRIEKEASWTVERTSGSKV